MILPTKLSVKSAIVVCISVNPLLLSYSDIHGVCYSSCHIYPSPPWHFLKTLLYWWILTAHLLNQRRKKPFTILSFLKFKNLWIFLDKQYAPVLHFVYIHLHIVPEIVQTYMYTRCMGLLVYSSIYSFIHLSIHPPIQIFIHPSDPLLIHHPSINSSTHPSDHLFIHPSNHPSIYPSIQLSIHPTIYSSIQSFINSFIHQTNWLAVCTNKRKDV